MKDMKQKKITRVLKASKLKIQNRFRKVISSYKERKDIDNHRFGLCNI
jgi:hypothetical protein